MAKFKGDFFKKTIFHISIMTVTYIITSYIIKGFRFDIDWKALVVIILASSFTLKIIYDLKNK